MSGMLDWAPAAGRTELLAPSVVAALEFVPDAQAAPIDPTLSDTAEFCAHYGFPLEASANCVVVAGKRNGELRYAACLILATDRADVNGVIRRELDVRKVSFAPMAEATELTGMEYGGITPIGLPPEWPIFVDAAVAAAPEAVIGAGLRAAKLLVSGKALASLPNARVLPLALGS
ncbi:YbaK/EbsC family protein [Actinocorallia lasiicapitis]